VGFAEHVGHQATYKLLTVDTRKIIYRSRVRLADKTPTESLNLTMTLKTPSPQSKGDTVTFSSSPLDNEELIGRSFLREPADNGERHGLLSPVFEDHLTTLTLHDQAPPQDWQRRS
jgi:hypothetical protein